MKGGRRKGRNKSEEEGIIKGGQNVKIHFRRDVAAINKILKFTKRRIEIKSCNSRG